MSQEPDRIVVSTDKLARCQWCGSPQSNEWVYSEKGGVFCSNECETAAGAKRAWLSSIVMLLCSLLIIIPYTVIWAFGYSRLAVEAFEFFFWAFALFIVSLGGFAYYFEGKKYQDRKGKFGGSAPIECEYCRHSNPPSATRCLNCDATLTRAPFTSETIPPWISKQKKTTGVKCPICNAVYSYLPAMISDEGEVNCQNCNRRFTAPIPSGDLSPDLQRSHY